MNATALAHAEFVEARRAYLGGTDIAAVLGIAPSAWGSPLSVYMDKREAEKTEDHDTLPMRRGLALERFIADEFQRARPELVCYHPKPVVRTDWGFPAGASVDFFVAHRDKPRTPVAVMDSKAAFSFFSARQWSEPDNDLPDHYYVQQCWYMAVTGLPLTYVAADTGKEQLTIVEITPREDVQQRLIDAGYRFWTNHVVPGIPPTPIGAKADAEALLHLWPQTIPEPAITIDSDEAEAELSDYLAHSLKAKEHTEAAEQAKQKLQARMGAHEQAVVGTWRLKWARQERTTLDTKRLKAEDPATYAKYARTSESRPFAQPKEMTP